MNLKQTIDSKASQGTRLILQGQSREACDILLEAWELVKQLMQDEGHANLDALDRAYTWTEPVFNWAQDLEQELYNVGLDDSAYLEKRIAYGYELIDRSQGMNTLLIENTRQAIAESHYMLGDQETCDRLFQGWLDEDPTWGWGIIHWADCYHLGLGKGVPDLARAEAIIRQGLEHPGIRDRDDVLERAIDIYQELGDNGKAVELQAERRRLATATRAVHVGRNDPCPCGSGKKYKKCCGK